MGLRHSYTAFNKAVTSLYGDTLQLADSGKPFEFDDAAFEQAASVIYSGGGFKAEQLRDPRVRKVVETTAGVISTAIGSGLPHEVPETVRGALENNAFVFSGFKTYHSLREVGLSMVKDDGSIKPYGEFLEDVRRINAEYNHNYLYAEYNHAVGSSQMAAKWHDIEKDGDRYNLQYRTAGDDRVREEHAILNGTTLPPSDPFWSLYFPPNGWNCRCTAVQVRKSKYPTSDPELAMERGNNCTDGIKQRIFRYNAGKTLQLYPPKHPYFKATQGAEQAVFSLSRRQAQKVAAEVKRESPNLQTGILYQSHKATKRAIGETWSREELAAMLTMPDHLDAFRFVRFSPLGEVKDLTDPKQAQKVRDKKKRGVRGYNEYEATINGVTWEVKTELFKNGTEAIYHIKKK